MNSPAIGPDDEDPMLHVLDERERPMRLRSLARPTFDEHRISESATNLIGAQRHGALVDFLSHLRLEQMPRAVVQAQGKVTGSKADIQFRFHSDDAANSLRSSIKAIKDGLEIDAMHYPSFYARSKRQHVAVVNIDQRSLCLLLDGYQQDRETCMALLPPTEDGKSAFADRIGNAGESIAR